MVSSASAGKVTSRRVMGKNGRVSPASIPQRLKRGRVSMRIPILLRGALVALIALFGVGLQSANADSGSITGSELLYRLLTESGHLVAKLVAASPKTKEIVSPKHQSSMRFSQHRSDCRRCVIDLDGAEDFKAVPLIQRDAPSTCRL